MKILIISPVYFPYIIGGGEYSTQYIAEGLAELGHEVIVYSLGMKNEVAIVNKVSVIREYKKGTSEYYFSKVKGNAFSSIGLGIGREFKIINKAKDLVFNRSQYKKYIELYSKICPDCIHSVSALSYMGRYNAWKAGYDLGIPVSHVARCPELVTFDFANGKLDYIYRWFSRKSFKYISYFAAPTEYMINLHNRYGIKAHTQTIIKNCVRNVPLISNDSNFDYKKNRILYAGDIRPEKGILTLLKAFSSLSKYELLIIGQGKLPLNEIKKDKNIVGLEIIPWITQDELFSMMQSSKLVVLPSEWEEAFGRVLIESIFNGTIAIGSDQGGIPEVLHNDRRFIFKSKASDELAQKIDWVMRLNKDEYNILLREQQEWSNEYNYDQYVHRWESFFINQRGKK